MFDYVVRVGKNLDENMFYDIRLEVGTTLPSTQNVRQGYKTDPTSGNSIAQNEPIVKNNLQNEDNQSQDANAQLQNTDIQSQNAVNSPSNEDLQAELERLRAENDMLKNGSANSDVTHTPEQLQVMQEYENAVDEDILNFIEYAKGAKEDNKTSITLSEVNDRAVNDIKSLTDIDVTGYEHNLKANTIRHINQNHGINGKTDNSMADERDIARLEYVLNNYDDIEILDDISKEYRDKNQNPSPIIRYSKRIDGTYYVVEAVPDTKKQQLPVVSAYKTKATERQTSDVQAPTRNVRNASAGDALSDYSITQKGNVVNSENQNRDEMETEYREKTLPTVYEKLNEEYGSIPKGEKPQRDVNVPKKSSEKKYVSRAARTLMEAGITPDENINEFREAIEQDRMSHMILSDKDAMAQSTKKIKELGFEGALDRWNSWVDSDGIPGKVDMAMGMQLYNQCITSKDVENAMKIAVDLCTLATRTGQSTQAFRLIKQMSADGQLYMIEQSAKNLENERRRKEGDKFKGIEVSSELAQKYIEAADKLAKLQNQMKEADNTGVTDEDIKNAKEAVEVAYREITEDIASQVKATKMEKWDAWRYLCMLGNIKTHFRNIIGNAIFIPARQAKNGIGTILEKTLPKEQRTKALHSAKGTKEFARDDFKKVEAILSGDGGKYNTQSGDINKNRQIFKNKLLDKLRKLNEGALEWEDMQFLRFAYVDTLSKAMTARGLTPEFLNSGTLEAAESFY